MRLNICLLESALSPSNSSLFLDLLLVGLVIGFEVADLTHAVGVYWFVGVRTRCGLLKLVSCMVTSIAHVPSYLIFIVMGTFDLLAVIGGVGFVHMFMTNFDDVITKVGIVVLL